MRKIIFIALSILIFSCAKKFECKTTGTDIKTTLFPDSLALDTVITSITNDYHSVSYTRKGIEKYAFDNTYDTTIYFYGIDDLNGACDTFLFGNNKISQVTICYKK